MTTASIPLETETPTPAWVDNLLSSCSTLDYGDIELRIAKVLGSDGSWALFINLKRLGSGCVVVHFRANDLQDAKQKGFTEFTERLRSVAYGWHAINCEFGKHPYSLHVRT